MKISRLSLQNFRGIKNADLRRSQDSIINTKFIEQTVIFRAAAAKLIRRARSNGQPATVAAGAANAATQPRGFIYVNNRFEGTALASIAAMLDAAVQP